MYKNTMVQKRTISKDLFLVIILIILENIFVKTFIYNILPSKYFYDALVILSGVTGNLNLDTSYMYAINIFKKINILGLDTLKYWGYYISIFILPILIYIVSKKNKYHYKQYIFLLASFTLLDIYVLGLSKDVIQFVYFLILYLILANQKMSNSHKLILACIVLLYEALHFRIYYSIMAMLMVTIYFIYIYFIRNQKINKKSIIKIMLISLILFFIEVFIVQIINFNNYNAILNARNSVNVNRIGSTDASTIINDLLGFNKNYFIFMGNYLINIIRLVFPLELITKGYLQIIFMIYQMFITINLIKSCKEINDNNVLWIITVISFIMISTIFEPDFGSFVRHESTLFLILLEITNINYSKEKKEIKNAKN